MKNKGWQHASVIGQWGNSLMSKQICVSLSSWRGNFVPVIAPPSSPKLLLISAFQFPPLCKRWVLTYFRLSLRREREAEKMREQESRDEELLCSQFSPASGFPEVWECRKGKICPKIMLYDPCLMSYSTYYAQSGWLCLCDSDSISNYNNLYFRHMQ